MNEPEKLRARLRLAIERTGLGPEEFSRESGISERQVRAILDDRETVGSHRMELIHRVMRTARRVEAETEGGNGWTDVKVKGEEHETDRR